MILSTNEFQRNIFIENKKFSSFKSIGLNAVKQTVKIGAVVSMLGLVAVTGLIHESKTQSSIGEQQILREALDLTAYNTIGHAITMSDSEIRKINMNRAIHDGMGLEQTGLDGEIRKAIFELTASDELKKFYDFKPGEFGVDENTLIREQNIRDAEKIGLFKDENIDAYNAELNQLANAVKDKIVLDLNNIPFAGDLRGENYLNSNSILMSSDQPKTQKLIKNQELRENGFAMDVNTLDTNLVKDNIEKIRNGAIESSTPTNSNIKNRI